MPGAHLLNVHCTSMFSMNFRMFSMNFPRFNKMQNLNMVLRAPIYLQSTPKESAHRSLSWASCALTCTLAPCALILLIAKSFNSLFGLSRYWGHQCNADSDNMYMTWKWRLVIDILKFDCQRRKLACKTHRFLPSSPGQKTSGNLSPNLCCLLDICFLLGKLQPFDQTLRFVSLLPPLMVKV